MSDRPEKYSLKVPEDVIGNVLAELVDRGGLIVAMDNDAGVIAVRAEMPDGSMTNFGSWLAKATLNRGSVQRIEI